MKITSSFFSKLPLLFTTLLLHTANAQQGKIITIETKSNVTALAVGNDLRLATIYFGPKLTDTAEYRFVQRMYRRGDDYSGILNAAYTPAGSRNLVEPAIEVTHANGNTSLDLLYVSSSVRPER